jgi:sporulation protein YlmC with PRC-barrel domain
VELSEPFGFSRLLDRRVVDQSGRSLGHAFELLAREDRDGTLTIEEILVGKAALLRRLHGPGAARTRIPWEAVIEVRDDRIVVRADAG